MTPVKKSPGLDKLKRGDFNTMHQDWQADGSVIVELSSRGQGKIHRVHVRDLYGSDEDILDESILPSRIVTTKEDQ